MKKIIRRLWVGLFLVCLVSLNFGFLVRPVRAEGENTIIITEVMSAPPGDNAKNQWVEIYNYGNTNIDLKDWKLWENDKPKHGLNGSQPDLILAGGNYAIIANNSTTFFVNNSTTFFGNLIDSSFDFVNGSGGKIGFKYTNGADIIPATNYPATAENQTARLISGAWTTSTPTPGSGFDGVLPTTNTSPSPDNPDTGDTSDPPADSPIVSATSTLETEELTEAKACPPGSVVINEIVSDPVDDEVEWVELYNRSTKTVDLTYWLIQDADEKPHTIAHETLELAGLSHMVLYKGKDFNFALNNSGEILQLVCYNNIMDSVTYGKFDDGQPEDNAPIAKDPFSLARLEDGRDTNSDKDDFAVTATPTPGRANIINTNSEATQSPDSGQIFTNKIVISEILPNPAGSDSQTEFIELYNSGEQEVDLTGWKLSDSGTRLVSLTAEKFGDLKLGAGKYLVLWRQQTGVALNNSGQDAVKLYWPNNKIADEMEYSGAVADDTAYARTADGVWFWSQKATPGAPNEIIQANQCPQAVINFAQPVAAGVEALFDGSDSSDPDGEGLSFLWSFADKTTSSLDAVKKTFAKSGAQKLVLKVTDENECSAEAKIEFTVAKSGTVAGTTAGSSSSADLNAGGATSGAASGATGGGISSKAALGTAAGAPAVYLSEILPNPKGADSGQEWLEICGHDNQPARGLQLELETSGAPKVYQLDTLDFSAGLCRQINPADLKITLPNTAATLRLRDSGGNVLDMASYTKAPEGQGFVWAASTGWSWSAETTPGALNPGAAAVLGGSVNAGDRAGNANFLSGAAEGISVMGLAAIKNLPEGALVTARGQVLVLPGVLGSQIFYIGDENAGLQIYMYKKDWPALKLGDWLEITGTVTPSGQQKRLKTISRDDIIILKAGGLPMASQVDLAELQEDSLDALITADGTLNSRSGRTWLLSDNDQTLEVYFKQNIAMPEYEPGTPVKITGILSWAEDHYRLLPRTAEDIEAVSSTSGTSEALTATSTRDFLAGEAMAFTLGGNGDWQRAWTVLGLVGGGLGLFLLGLYIGKRKAI